MNQKLKKWATFTLRWGIAVFGIWYVLSKTSFHDRVMILDPANRPVSVRIVDGASETSPVFKQADGPAVISRDQVWTVPDRPSVVLQEPDGSEAKAKLLAVHQASDQQANQPPLKLLIQDPKTHQPEKVDPSQVVGGYKVSVVHPMIEVGLLRLLRDANPWYLLLAVLLLPISYLITSARWHMLLETVDIRIGQGRTFVLNMVGSFYNSFMPGSTGGDLVKAYYAARHTTHRTRAVMSVLIDRILGLIALIILGGVMAATQWQIHRCRQVAIGSGLLLVATAVGLFVFYHRTLRRRTGLDWLLKHMPMQHQVHRAVETMEIYGRHPWVSIAAVLMTFPVHITTVLSATFAGKAFGLPLPVLYYWAVVPVIILVGAIPISPQGAGVMEYFAVELMAPQGVSVSQAFALVMAIRCCQIFWNLVAALFVFRGGYHAPSQKEAESLEEDEAETVQDAPLKEPIVSRTRDDAPIRPHIQPRPLLNPEP